MDSFVDEEYPETPLLVYAGFLGLVIVLSVWETPHPCGSVGYLEEVLHPVDKG
jgi:hypothetical protein